jgi:ATP-dependent DNA helicase PIF1
MSNLSGPIHLYRAKDGGLIQDITQREKLLSNLLAPVELKLRLDAQVMLIKNTDETLVNGSVGKVVDFVDEGSWRSSSGADAGIVLGESAEDAKKKKAAVAASKGGTTQYPVVKFPITGAPGYFREVMIMPETWKIELPSGEIQASRTQV